VLIYLKFRNSFKKMPKLMLNRLHGFDKTSSFTKEPRLTHLDCGLIRLKFSDSFVKAAL
jgi:hypothetical protein